MPNQYSENIIILKLQRCEQCNQEFYDYRLRRFCSLPCYHLSLRTLPDVECPVCGKVFHPHIQYGKLQTVCSLQCRGKYYSRERHASWKGGKYLDSEGYIRVPVGLGEREREHRVVMESHLGRQLEVDECVHHKNGNRTDNRLVNLDILSKSEHTKLHCIGRPPKPPIICALCGKLRKHQAKGYCASCYSRQRLEARMRVDPEGTKRRLRETSYRSRMRRKV